MKQLLNSLKNFIISKLKNDVARAEGISTRKAAQKVHRGIKEFGLDTVKEMKSVSKKSLADK